MKYELDSQPFSGFAAEAAVDGQTLTMIVKGFFTPDDGHAFYRILERLDARFLGPFRQAGHTVSVIDHCLVFLSTEGKATVYVNQIPMFLKIMARRPLKAGEDVRRRDIGPIAELNLGDIPVPQKSAIIFYFSVNWRRGIYLDFTPLQGKTIGDLSRVLGQAFERLWFAELFSVPANLWPRIFGLGWFPFISLIGGPFEELFGFLERDIMQAWEEKILARYDESAMREMLEHWRKAELLREHMPFLECGIERYLAGDYLSAVGNTWPRIEGILRFIYSGPAEKPGQKGLLEDMRKVLEEKALAPATYMPALFGDYLLSYYYQDFTLKPNEPVDLSRHSHAHGVAASESYDRKKSLIAFLIVHQLFYYIKIGYEQRGKPST